MLPKFFGYFNINHVLTSHADQQSLPISQGRNEQKKTEKC